MSVFVLMASGALLVTSNLNVLAKSKISNDIPSVQEQAIDLSRLGYLPFRYIHHQLVWNEPLPLTVKHLWTTRKENVLLTGAIMQFQSQSGISIDGIFGTQTWTTMKNALANNLQNHNGYTYVFVSEKKPETLTVYHNGKVVLTTLVNTGVTGAETPIGTFPVYLRYVSQTMEGTNVNGQFYKDRGVPFVNYFDGGCAIHGFVRKSYGYPQSLGCVELPISKAKVAWQYIDYGTPVTVEA